MQTHVLALVLAFGELLLSLELCDCADEVSGVCPAGTSKCWEGPPHCYPKSKVSNVNHNREVAYCGINQRL